MRERNYFAAMMVNEGDADGLVTGHSRSYSSVVKPMLQLVDKAAELHYCYHYMMMTARGPMFLSDTAINIDPSADDLAKLHMTAKTARMFGVDPV
jgi:malate dehydrogenase (oxaloacetate-decarboxylating)(NADP+)